MRRSISGKISILTAAALIIALAAVIATAATYAHYRSVYRSAGSLGLRYDYSSTGIWMVAAALDGSGDPTGQPISVNGEYILPGGWTKTSEDGDEYKVSFLLSNEKRYDSPADFDQYGYIQVFVGEGAGSASALTVVAEVNGISYRGAASAVTQGTALYEAYGPGWIYEFKNGSERVSWLLTGGVSEKIPVTLTVSGTSGYPVSVNVIAAAKPAN